MPYDTITSFFDVSNTIENYAKAMPQVETGAFDFGWANVDTGPGTFVPLPTNITTSSQPAVEGYAGTSSSVGQGSFVPPVGLDHLFHYPNGSTVATVQPPPICNNFSQGPVMCGKIDSTNTILTFRPPSSGNIVNDDFSMIPYNALDSNLTQLTIYSYNVPTNIQTLWENLFGEGVRRQFKQLKTLNLYFKKTIPSIRDTTLFNIRADYF